MTKQRESDGTLERQITANPEQAKRSEDFPILEPHTNVYVPIYDSKGFRPAHSLRSADPPSFLLQQSNLLRSKLRRGERIST